MSELPEQRDIPGLLCEEGDRFRTVHRQVTEIRAKMNRLSLLSTIASDITYCALHHAVQCQDCNCAALGFVSFAVAAISALYAKEDADNLEQLVQQEKDVLESIRSVLIDPLAGDIAIREKAAGCGLHYPHF